MALTAIGEVPQWGGVADWSSCRTTGKNLSNHRHRTMKKISGAHLCKETMPRTSTRAILSKNMSTESRWLQDNYSMLCNTVRQGTWQNREQLHSKSTMWFRVLWEMVLSVETLSSRVDMVDIVYFKSWWKEKGDLWTILHQTELFQSYWRSWVEYTSDDDPAWSKKNKLLKPQQPIVDKIVNGLMDSAAKP